MATVAARFWAKVRKTDTCWLWTGKHHVTSGYGQFWRAGRVEYAHRVGYELQNGPIPAGLDVLHRCDVRACVRGEHLFPGDDRMNQADAKAKGRLNRARGPQNGNARLTPAKVQQIRRRAAAGDTQDAIAADHGVSQAVVSQIVRRVTWTHVA